MLNWSNTKISLQLICATTLALLIFSASVGAEDALSLLRFKDCRDARINLTYHDAPLRQILTDLERMRGKMNIKIRAENTEQENTLLTQPVTIAVSGVTWDTALSYLADRLNLSIDRRREKDGLVFLEKIPSFSAVLNGVGFGSAVAEIARFGKANVVFSPAVDTTKPVHITLQNVPWPQALETVLKAHSCVIVEEESGIMRIATIEEAGVRRETRLRPLRFIVPEGKLSLEKLSTTVYPEKDAQEQGLPSARTAAQIVKILENVQSRHGSVGYEQRTNTLVLTDVPEKVREMLRIVDTFDVPAHQVLLETIFASVDGNATSYPDVKWDFDTAWRGEKWDGEPVDSLSKTGVMNHDALTAFLLNAREDQCIRILQAPQMLVMDGEEASVFVGDLRQKSVADLTGELAGADTRRGVLLGSSMSVVPIVYPGTDRVVLEVFPVQTGEPIVDRKQSGQISIELPARLNVKAARTRMVLRSGETGVISGLFDQFDAKGVVKAASDTLGIIKKPFQKPVQTEIRRNNFFMVTPTIIAPDCGVEFDQDVQAARESLAALK